MEKNESGEEEGGKKNVRFSLRPLRLDVGEFDLIATKSDTKRNVISSEVVCNRGQIDGPTDP